MKSVFDIPAMDMPHVAAGQPIRAKDFNTVADAVERIQKGVVPPQQVFPDTNGGLGEIIACKVVTVHKDHLVCTKKEGGGTINVARPLAARSPDSEAIFSPTVNWTYAYTDVVNATTPPSGYQARTATSFPTTTQQEEQIILRPYTVGGEIRAGRVLGGTGVPEADTYEEIHTDRTWYRKVAAA